MNIPRIFAMTCALLSTYAFAQSCDKIQDNQLRLACYDRASGFVREANPKPEAPAIAAFTSPRWYRRLYLRDDANPNKGIGSAPATFSLVRSNGEDASLVKFGIAWFPEMSPFPGVLGDYGWGPFLSVSMNRNTLTAKRTDFRTFGAGLSGTVFDIDKSRFALWSSLRLMYQEDNKLATQSNVVQFDNYVVSDYLRRGIPYHPEQTAIFIAPRFGLALEDKNKVKTGENPGFTQAAYVSVRGDFYPGILSERIRISGLAQRFVDYSVPSGATKRRDNYFTASLDYVLQIPEPNSWVMPSIGIERSVGADPLTGTPRGNQTMLTLRLQLN